MRRVWGRGNIEHPINDLVAIAVIGDRNVIVVGPAPVRRAGHIVGAGDYGSTSDVVVIVGLASASIVAHRRHHRVNAARPTTTRRITATRYHTVIQTARNWRVNRA